MHHHRACRGTEISFRALDLPDNAIHRVKIGGRKGGDSAATRIDFNLYPLLTGYAVDSLKIAPNQGTAVRNCNDSNPG